MAARSAWPGLHDWTIEGVHLCMTRLNLLRLNTMPALDRGAARRCRRDCEALDNAQLRELGRLAVSDAAPKRGERGFRRITWDEALERIARRLRADRSAAVRVLRHLARRDERSLLRGAKSRALSRHQQRR